MEQLTAGHGALTAMRTGRGRDLVLFHALFADRTLFDPLLPQLAERFRVTLFNLPGFHGSEPAMLPLMDAYLARLEDGYREFDIAPDAVLLGAGFGGLLALAFALDHPERSAKLVVSDAAAGFPDEGKKAFAVMEQKVAEDETIDVGAELAVIGEAGESSGGDDGGSDEESSQEEESQPEPEQESEPEPEPEPESETEEKEPEEQEPHLAIWEGRGPARSVSLATR